jgi:hypothetical protein
MATTTVRLSCEHLYSKISLFLPGISISIGVFSVYHKLRSSAYQQIEFTCQVAVKFVFSQVLFAELLLLLIINGECAKVSAIIVIRCRKRELIDNFREIPESISKCCWPVRYC